MVLDTSALLAVLLQEPEAPAFAVIIETAESVRMSTANVLESSIVLRSRKRIEPAESERILDEFLDEAGVQVEAVSADQLAIARAAYAVYGKGSHAAQLNLGDTFAYALAKAFGEPLLFKGDDFSRTDIAKAA
jgi:ribonuclease VapC